MAAAAAAAPNGNSNGNHHGLQGDVSVTYLYIECCYGTAVGTGTARYQNPGRWIWPDPTASRVWYRAVPILSLCSTTRRTEVEGQKRNFVCNNRIGRDGRAARTLEVLRFSIDRRRRCLLDRRRRLLEVNSAVAAAAAGNEDIDAATAAGNNKFAAGVAFFNVAAATAAGRTTSTPLPPGRTTSTPPPLGTTSSLPPPLASTPLSLGRTSSMLPPRSASTHAGIRRSPPLDCFNAWLAPLSSDPTHAETNGRCVLIRVLDETIRRLEQLFRFTQADNPGPAVLLRIIGRINRANTRRSTLFAQLHTYIRRRRRRHHQQQAPPSPPAGGNIASNGNGAAINNGNSNNAAAGAPPADA
ncbi:hypothetical protein OsI_18010 [Oryza sativa Indica Group]|uniref:Uncharacterized protein n=1 Tax=Oryza sativa subsp. indica TaxID=39946 RepID=B8ARU0_ORYSI|nr:hypothetical protein OsI_18010 [Oryza sativa Indica Group]